MTPTDWRNLADAHEELAKQRSPTGHTGVVVRRDVDIHTTLALICRHLAGPSSAIEGFESGPQAGEG